MTPEQLRQSLVLQQEIEELKLKIQDLESLRIQKTLQVHRLRGNIK